MHNPHSKDEDSVDAKSPRPTQPQRGSDKAARVHLGSLLKNQGKTLVGYGAAAKAATLLHMAGVDSRHLDYIVDRNTHKHGRYMPGIDVPIYDPAELVRRQPDYVLLLAWNLRNEIVSQQHEYLNAGGKILIPIPNWTVVDAGSASPVLPFTGQPGGVFAGPGDPKSSPNPVSFD